MRGKTNHDKVDALGEIGGYGNGSFDSPFGLTGGFSFESFMESVVTIAVMRAQSEGKDNKAGVDSSKVYIETISGNYQIPLGLVLYLENIGEISDPQVVVGIERNDDLDQVYPNSIYDLLKGLASLTKGIRDLKSRFIELRAIEATGRVDIILDQELLGYLLGRVNKDIWLNLLHENKNGKHSQVMRLIVELVCLSASEVTVKVGIDQYALFLTFVPSDDDTRDQLHFLLGHKNMGEEEVPIGDELLRRMGSMLGGYLLSSGLRGDVVVVKDKAKNEEVEL